MQRRVDLDGPSNYRDLGGLPVTGGGSTRFGQVFRADRLCTLSDADLRRLENAGIRHVFDLRSQTEADEFPDRLPSDAAYTRLSMTSDETFHARTIYERIVEGEIKSYGEAEMVAGYVRILQNFGPSFALIVRQVAQGEPTIIHCTAGKDRTGVAAMLLLDLAGVVAEHVVADYALWSERRPSLQRDHTEANSLVPMLEDYGLDPAGFAPLWEARAAVMAATLEQLHDRWGGAAPYLAAAGMDDPDLEAARACLLAQGPSGP
ncbi:MAG: tyrosine-protein phosphatase [Acidimicrobiaceae bacterium]|nr:tyrosine-protein phosphatase [Acidimicrobiaceae bacterium]